LKVNLHGRKQVNSDFDLVDLVEVRKGEVGLGEGQHGGQVDVLRHDGFHLLGNHTSHGIVGDFPELNPPSCVPVRLDLDQLQLLEQLVLIDAENVPLDTNIRGR